MEVLNLDDLATPVTRAVTLTVNGKKERFEVKEMTVEGFIQFTRMSRELEEKARKNAEEGKATTIEDSIEMSIATLKVALPEVAEEILRGLNLAQLMALIRFINGELDKAQQAGAGTVTEGEPEKKS